MYVHTNTMVGETLQTWEVSKPYLNLRCLIGEGPYYEKGTNSLQFVDIKKTLHSISLDEGPNSLKTIQLDGPVAVTRMQRDTTPRRRCGLALLGSRTGEYEYLTKFTDGLRRSQAPKQRRRSGSPRPLLGWNDGPTFHAIQARR